jgi:2-polyprenyl-3-methyl-5-hydroxy-6-metoxy-1,4-benzoquinol methylase
MNAIPTSVGQPRPVCWCGERELRSFSPEYRLCRTCHTLVSQAGLETAETLVRDDERDFYGKTYWFEQMTAGLGQPDISRRARADLSERCMHWLRTLLRFAPPPARVLEIGCSHGGFVALLRSLGYDATGLELSPWVVEFAKATFAVPMLLGPIEAQGLPEQSFDAIVLNDVVEHLPDPTATLGYCTRLLADDGILVVQMPCYPEGTSYEELQARGDRFLEQMEGKARQHLHLFSRRAARQLFDRLGFPAVEFLPALFAYDMYLVAGRHTRAGDGLETLAATLMATPAGRVTLAWLDLLVECEAREADRASRLEQIHRLHEWLRQSEADRTALRAANERLVAGAPAAGQQGGGKRPWLLRALRLMRRPWIVDREKTDQGSCS